MDIALRNGKRTVKESESQGRVMAARSKRNCLVWKQTRVLICTGVKSSAMACNLANSVFEQGLLVLLTQPMHEVAFQ